MNVLVMCCTSIRWLVWVVWVDSLLQNLWCWICDPLQELQLSRAQSRRSILLWSWGIAQWDWSSDPETTLSCHCFLSRLEKHTWTMNKNVYNIMGCWYSCFIFKLLKVWGSISSGLDRFTQSKWTLHSFSHGHINLVTFGFGINHFVSLI